MEHSVYECSATLYRQFPKLYRRDLVAVEEYFQVLATRRELHPERARDLLYDFEFDARSQNPQRGTRRAYRDPNTGRSTQNVTSLRALSAIFEREITNDHLRRGKVPVTVAIPHDGRPVEYRFEVKLPTPGQVAQPVHSLYCEYQSAINQIYDDRITEDDRTIACRRFLVKMLRHVTLRLGDAHFIYHTIAKHLQHEIGTGTLPGYHYYSFSHAPPYFAFLMWALALHQRVLYAHQRGFTPTTGRPHGLVFDRDSLRDPESEQSNVLTVIKSVLGINFNNPEHAQRRIHPRDNTKVLVTIHFNDMPRLLTDANVSMILFVALYMHQCTERHSFVAQDEASVVYACGLVWLGGVYSTPRVLVKSGGLRLLYSFFQKAGIYFPAYQKKRVGGVEKDYFPRDVFSNARLHRIICKGSLELFLGLDLIKEILKTNTMELPVLPIMPNPMDDIRAPNWPAIDYLTAQQESEGPHTPLGGYGRIFFLL